MGKKKSQKNAGSKARATTDEPPAADIPSSGDGETADELKVRGNAFVRDGDHARAHAIFTEAITCAADDHAELHILYSNRSLCALTLGRHGDALADATKCISLQPQWAKGHARVGAAHAAAGDHQEAAKAYALALSLDPSNPQLLDAVARSQSALAAGTATTATNTKREDASGPPKAVSTGEEPSRTGSAPAGNRSGGDDLVIGIDLGTTFSCVAVCQPGVGRVEIIPNADGSRTTPSWVAFSEHEGTRMVGMAAKNQAAANPRNTINDAKRLIGRHFSESEVQADLKHLSCKVVAGAHDKPLITVSAAAWGGEVRSFAPEQVSAMVLQQLKADAEAFLGRPVCRCVITVPAHFNDAQRAATKDAGAIAGMSVLRVINEPTAAALAYGLDALHSGKESKVLVFDLGGGTFDVSVLAMEGGIFEVRATGGNTRLGGEDIDSSTAAWVLQTFAKAHPKVEVGERAMRRLYATVERAKRQLSSTVTAEIEIESFAGGEDLRVPLTRAKFETLNMVHFTQCLDTVKSVLKDAAVKKEQIDEVVLVGGSTRIPKLRQLLSDFFGGKALCNSINPDEAVAFGAAVQAGVLGGSLAAAGGALGKASESLVLMDVVPLSLGIETTGRVMSTVVKRNTPIPTRKSDTFTTEEDWQTEVDIVVYEGERVSTDACNELGRFTISGLERAKRGEPQVLVTFDIDANGILSVSAVDKKTNAKASTTIAATSARNSPAEVERMVAEAKKYAAADEQMRRKAEARRELEDAIFDVLDDDDASAASRERAEDAEAWLQQRFDALSVHDIQRKALSLRRA